MNKAIQEIFPLIEAGKQWMPSHVTPESFAGLMEQSLKIPQSKIVVRRDKEGKPSGIVWCEVLSTKDLFVHYIYAKKDGKKLMQTLERVAKENACERISGITRREANFVDKIFVKKYGYEIIGYWIQKGVK